MITDTVDARAMSCTQLQRCEYYSSDDRDKPVVYVDSMQHVDNFWTEVDRRGEDHVFSCSGIYPTGHNPDGSPRFDGEVCTFGDEVAPA